MKNSLFSVVISVCFFALFYLGCENNKVSVGPEQEVANMETESAIGVLLDYGFSRENIEVGDDFLFAEEDIGFSKQSLLEQAKQLQKTAQRCTTTLNSSAASNIKIKIHESLQGYPFAWRNAIEIALNKWKSVSGSLLHFSLVSSGQDILIFSDLVEDTDIPDDYKDIYEKHNGAYGLSTYPPDANTPGMYISIDIDDPRLAHFYCKLEVAMHEIGHAFGLLHPDVSAGSWIEGTPEGSQEDPLSVMNKEVDYNYHTRYTLSEGDNEAVRVLYPDE